MNAIKKIFRSPLLKYLIFFALSVVVLVLAYSGYIIFHYTGFNLQLVSTANSQQVKELEFEDDSMVNYEDFKALYEFSDNIKNFKQWFKEKQQSAVVESRFIRGEKKIIFIQSVSLKIKWQNDCERAYCFQRKTQFSDFPIHIVQSLIGVEDFRFLTHQGVDIRAILRAIWIDLKAMKLKEGASTITQQLIRNIYLSNEKSFERKINEMILSIYFESFYTKENILEMYLNEIMMGSISGIRIKGVAAAAYFYFGTSIDNITSYQAAILISLLNGPYFYHPLRNLKGLQEKTNLVYQKLKKNKVISSLANEDWNDLQWEKWKKVLEDKKSKSYLKAISYMQKNPNLTEIYPKYAMLAKALTTLRAEKQKHPEADIALKIFSKEINCKEFPCTKEFHYYSKVEKDLLMGIQSEKHQVGSLLKPLIYRFYLNEALEWDYMIDTTSYTLELKSGHWTPKDAKKAEQEYITLKEAYQRSRNVPLVRVAHSIGFSFLENYLLQYIPNLKTPLEEFPSQILGSIEMSIKEIAEVFEEFMQKECQYYINDQPNVIQPIFEHGKTTVRYRVPNILKEVRFFGKTGTSNDGIDNWYVGIESNKVTVIWMGLETNKSNPIKGYSGSSLAFPIYINYLAFGGKSVQELDCEQLVNNRLQKDL